MSMGDMVKFTINGIRIYAESARDLADAMVAIIGESEARVAASMHALKARCEALEDDRTNLAADLDRMKTTSAYGPELVAERDNAIATRDQALRDFDDVKTVLDKERKARMETDRLRRGLAGDVRRLQAELAAAKDRGDIYQDAIDMQAARQKRGGKRAAKKGGRK